MSGQWRPGGKTHHGIDLDTVARVLRGALAVRHATAGLGPEQRQAWARAFRRTALRGFDEKLRHTLARTGEADALGVTEFSGMLRALSVGDLVQALAIGLRDGVVAVAHDGMESRLWCRAGEIVDAESGPLQSEDAVYHMLALERGQVSAELCPVQRPRRVSRSTAAMLLEAARRRDDREIEKLARATSQVQPPAAKPAPLEHTAAKQATAASGLPLSPSIPAHALSLRPALGKARTAPRSRVSGRGLAATLTASLALAAAWCWWPEGTTLRSAATPEHELRREPRATATTAMPTSPRAPLASAEAVPAATPSSATPSSAALPATPSAAALSAAALPAAALPAAALSGAAVPTAALPAPRLRPGAAADPEARTSKTTTARPATPRPEPSPSSLRPRAPSSSRTASTPAAGVRTPEAPASASEHPLDSSSPYMRIIEQRVPHLQIVE